MCKSQTRKRYETSGGKSNNEEINQVDNKYLIPCPKGNSEFCFPQDFQCWDAGETKLNHCFLWGQSLGVLLYLPTKK